MRGCGGCGTKQPPKWASASFKMPNAIEVSHALRVALLWRRIRGLFRLSRVSLSRVSPDFLWRLVASANFMRLSEEKQVIYLPGRHWLPARSTAGPLYLDRGGIYL